MGQKVKIFILSLIILIFFSFVFSLTVNWDAGYSWHPDERMIVMTGLKLEWLFPWEAEFYQPDSVFNPKFFAYGSLPIYLVTLAKYFISLDYYTLVPYMRWINFIFLSGTALIIWRLSESATGSKRVGLTALLLTFLSFFIWQNAHFYTVDLPLTFWFIFVIYRLVLWHDGDRGLSNQIWLALSIAAGLATKFSMVLILPIVFLAVNLGKDNWGQKTLSLVKIGILSLLMFFIFQPYSFIDLIEYKRQILTQLAMAKSAYTFPYTLQYVGTKAYLYPITQLLIWGLGPFLSILALIGLLIIIKRGWFKQPDLGIWAGFSLLYFLVLGRSAVKFMRYYLPIYPFLIMAAAIGLVYISRLSRWRWLAMMVFALTAIWWSSFAVIHLKVPTRLMAAKWLDLQFPKIKVIGVEHWDDRLPTKQAFRAIEFPMYDSEVNKALKIRKQNLIKTNLNQIDAYILASPRLYKPLLNLADKYPVAANFYRRLFGHQTRLRQSFLFENYPRFLGWLIDDSSADESFYVYDHPVVIVFTK